MALAIPLASAQETDNTVTYPASYFQQWNPVTVADMIDRIPGIAIALEEPSNSRFQADRGLGSAESILINGRRLSGKDNDAREQLGRIPFDQVSHIEIIRGTSTELVGVRNTGQIVNIVTNTDNEMSITVATSVSHFQDGNVEPGASVVVNGSRNNLEYRLSAERRPAYQANEVFEESIHGVGDWSANDLRVLEDITDQNNLILNSNLSWQLASSNNFTVNALYQDSDPPRTILRNITDYNFSPARLFRESENYLATRDNWELGIDFNHGFDDGSQLQIISINNQTDSDTLRQRFLLGDDGSSQQDLALGNNTEDTERIYRAVYTRPLVSNHDLELGLERAQTTLETHLSLERLHPVTGQLFPITVPNANSTIQEIRYEGFAVHHWQINPRMKLESTLLYEVSEIAQSGDVSKVRDFDFVRPKLDYRFDITQTLQLQLSIEKFVAQLRFNDFAATADGRDEERDTLAGNPELRQQQSWRYTANLDYRFLEGRGVINARSWYWDVTDAIGRIDATEPGGPLKSVSGNHGDGEIMALQLNSSFRITPNLLLSGSALMRHSSVIDPFTGRDRRLVPNDRGHYTLGLRHDLPDLNLNYGFDYFGTDQGNRPLYDIDRLDNLDQQEDLSLFVERNSIGSLGLVARLEVKNVTDKALCSDRIRYAGHIALGIINEVERRCTERGTQYVLQLRGTF